MLNHVNENRSEIKLKEISEDTLIQLKDYYMIIKLVINDLLVG